MQHIKRTSKASFFVLVFLLSLLCQSYLIYAWSGSLEALPWYNETTYPYSYLIDKNSTHYFMFNGTTGKADFVSTNKTRVCLMANNNLTNGGLIYMKDLTWATSVTLGTYVNVIESCLGVMKCYDGFGRITLVSQFASDPSTSGWGSEFHLWYNTADGKIKFWDGTRVQELPSVVTGGEGGLGTYSYIIYKSGSTYYYADSAGAIKCSSTNASRIFQLSLDNLTLGGMIFVKAGQYSLTKSVIMKYSDQGIYGEGAATVLYLASSSNVDVVRIVGVGVKNCRVENLAIDGNDAGNTAGNGIYIDTDYASWDSAHILNNLWINYTDESGIYILYDTRVVYMNNINIRYPGENGMKLYGSDHYICNVEVGFAGFAGIRLLATSAKFVNVKLFACPTSASASPKTAWFLDGPDAAVYCTFTNCVAEDSRYNGWYLDQVREDTFVGCWAYDSSTVTTGWDGWNISASYRIDFSGCYSRDGDDGKTYRGFGCYSNCYYLTFSSVSASACLDTGFYLGNSDYCSLTGSCFASNGDKGIEVVSGGTYNIIMGCETPSNSVAGIVNLGGSTTKVNLCYNGTTWIS